MNKEEKCEMKHLNDLYEQALKDYEELQQRIDKIFSRITLYKMEDITMETARVLDDLLEVIKGESNNE